MSTVPYAGHKAPGRLHCNDDTPLGKLDYKLRAAVCDGSDLMVDAADMLQAIAKERDAADKRNKILEAEFTAMRADRDRLHTKLAKVGQMLEPQAWAEGSRNRTQLMEAVYDGVPAPAGRAAS